MRPSSAVVPDEIELGTVVGVFGFRGEVKLHLHNPDSDLLSEPKLVVLIAPDGRRFEAELSARPGAGQRILGRIEGVTDEAAARALRDYRIVISASALPALPEGEYYLWQLVGSEVFAEGQRVGRLVEVQSPGPVDVFVVERDDGTPILLLSLAENIASIDPVARRIELHPGALPPDEEPEPPEEL